MALLPSITALPAASADAICVQRNADVEVLALRVDHQFCWNELGHAAAAPVVTTLHWTHNSP